MTRYLIAMTNALPDLLERLSRLHLAERRTDDLNPAQIAALDYLGRANRFSRMPSAVADYLAATRGTVSQTLKALARKGLVDETRSDTDRRARRYDLTEAGRAALARLPQPATPDLPDDGIARAETALRHLLEAMLQARGGRSFGLCRTCTHHRRRDGGAHCALLDLPLRPEEADQICQDHAA